MKRAEVDMLEAQNKLKDLNDKDKKDESERYLSLKRTLSDRLNDKQGRLNQISDDLNRFDIDEKEKDKLYKEQKSLTREISRLKKDEYDVNSKINGILKTNLNEGKESSDEVLDVVDQYYSTVESPDFRGDTAQTIWKLTKDTFKFDTSYENIVKVLSQGAKPEEIIKAIGKQAGY
jgi:chromosome segregation ATPase